MKKGSPPKSHSALKRKETIRVLGFDVGKTNPAWAVVDVPKDGVPKTIAFSIAHAKITNFSSNGYLEPAKGRKMLNRVKSFSGQVRDFNIQISGLVSEYEPDFAVIERFQNRGWGKQGGEASEFCSVIVGAISSQFSNIGLPYELIAAGTWKTQFNNKFSIMVQGSNAQNAKPLEQVYTHTISPHITDALLMAIYSGMRLHGKTPYEGAKLEWLKGILQ